MDLLRDPIILTMFCLTALCGLVALQPRRRPEICLIVLTILLFALPRAGFVLRQLYLPLPLTHLLAVVLVLEWLLLSKTSYGEHRYFARFFLIYAIIAGFGLAVGLSTGGGRLVAFLELSFYLFSMGLFFYVSEVFRQRRNFMMFAHLVLAISVIVSFYGIAQRFLGAKILIPHLTYTSGGRDISLVADTIWTRVLSSYGDPNVLASQLIIFVGIGLALVVGRGLSSRARAWGFLILAVNVTCVIFTGSRAGMVCLALVPLIVLCWRTRWAILIIPGLLVLAAIFLPPFFESALAGKVSKLGPGITLDPSDLRAQFPAMAWQLLQAVPFGCGWGNTVVLQVTGVNWSFGLIPAEVIWMGFNSFWLNLFSRLGVPGVVAFVVILVMLFQYVRCRARLMQDAWVKAFLIGGLAGFVGQWAIWLVNNTYMLPGGGLNFWFTMGMLVAGCRTFTEQPYMILLPGPAVRPGKQTAPA